MARKAPGKSHRKGLTFIEVADMFRDEETAREWIADQRWPNGPHCPRCGTTNVQSGIKHKTMTHRCQEKACGKRMFSIKTGTVMEASNLPYRAWVVGIYLFTTNIKGVSSMRLHRELGISQKAAWFMLHRLRLAFDAETGPFVGPVEVDETYIGGKLGNMTAKGRKDARQKPDLDKSIVAGAKDRETKRVSARVVEYADKPTLQGFVAEHAEVAPGAKVYTDEARAYQGLSFDHETVRHSVGEYVREQASTNGTESFWAMLKRGHEGIYHKFSPKHLDRYVTEFAGRHNDREADTVDQMTGIVSGMVGKRLTYATLIADNGLDSGARS